MTHRTVSPVALAITLVLATGPGSGAQAGGGHYFPPVADPVVREDCGSCHITFPPSSLVPSISGPTLPVSGFTRIAMIHLLG